MFFLLSLIQVFHVSFHGCSLSTNNVLELLGCLRQYQHVVAWLQSRHSRGVPLQAPPKSLGKQEPIVAPPRAGPTYLTWQPPPEVQL